MMVISVPERNGSYHLAVCYLYIYMEGKNELKLMKGMILQKEYHLISHRYL